MARKKCKDSEKCKIVELGKHTKAYICEQTLCGSATAYVPMKLTVGRRHPTKTFIVESGAGIPKARREKQVISYLKKRFKSRGYI